MGRKSSISEEQGAALREAYRRLESVRAAAQEVGVSEDAAGRYLAKNAESSAEVVAQQQHIAESVEASILDMRTLLEENTARLKKLLAQLDKGMEKHGDAALETVSPKQIQAYVAASRAMSAQVESGIKLLDKLTDIEAILAFQQDVIEEIGAADPPTQQRILGRLKARRALGFALFKPTRS